MRKISLTLIIFLILIISIVLIYPKKEKEVLDANEENKSNFISMMLESEAGSNKFIENADLKFPLEGYHFNSEESGCENGGTLSWNSEKQNIEATLLTSDKCYAYFDNVQVKSEFDYIGNYEEYVVPSTGTYKIELWGAQGGGAYYDFGELLSYTEGYERKGEYINGGKGGYVSGIIDLKKGDVLYVYVGGIGTDYLLTEFHARAAGGYNGGGKGGFSYQIAAGGGGATDIRLVSGEWNDFNSLKSRIMVAGAGGGTSNWHNAVPGGYAGGLIGEAGQLNIGSVSHPLSTGGTQKSGGLGAIGKESYDDVIDGKFGQGGDSDVGHGGGGGAGYYGGGAGNYVNSGVSSGAGGSSFISGYPGCDAIAESSTKDAIVHTGKPVHYSGKVFTDAKLIAGNETMPSPSGEIEVGHAGSGYAKITLVK